MHNNDKISAVRIFDQICHFFPRQLLKFFKNLEAVAIQDSKLKDLTRDDLKELKNLKSLSLYGNELKTLEIGIFDANLKLEFLSLYNNKLTSMGSEILTPLKNLKKAFFHLNPCVNLDALSDDEMEVLKLKLTHNCPPSEDLQKLHARDEKLRTLEADFGKFSQKFSALKSQFKNCENSTESLSMILHAKNSTCVANEILALDMEKCDAKLRDLTATVMKFEIECGTFEGSVCVADDVITFYEEMEVKGVKFNGRLLEPDMVTTLELRGRNFHFMPTNFGDFFKNLENLTISNTRISKIDNTLENLNNLRSLKLVENKISQIPQNSLASLESLEVFDLTGNQIHEMSEGFGDLKYLREIYLDRNEISTLRWKVFAENSKIEIISMKGNRLMQIGSNFEVIASRNETFDDEIWNFDAVTVDSGLSSTTSPSNPANILSRFPIKFLDLSDNFCVNSQYPGENLTTLVQTFFVNCTLFINIECNFDEVSTCNTQNLDVDSENTKFYKNFTSNVEKLIVTDQNFMFCPQNLQEVFPNLTSVAISRSKLRKIPKFYALKELSVVKNGIKKLETGNFDNSPGIELINLSKNKLSTLPHEIFVKLYNLKVLNLNGNQLKALSHEIIATKNSIQEFHCADNQLDEIQPEIVKKLRKARFIDFLGNSCVDNKFNRSEDIAKKIMEIYGEIVFKCT